MNPSRLLKVFAVVSAALAVCQPVAAEVKLTAQQCYKNSARCTRFCGQANGDYRYECFRMCDAYLDNCLGRGIWTDQANARVRTTPERATGNPIRSFPGIESPAPSK